MAGNAKDPEISPDFAFAKREEPLKKITIKKMPDNLFRELERKADAYTLSVPNYCRAALECAAKHQHLYKGPVAMKPSTKVIADEINIPVTDKAFLDLLQAWKPYGHTKNSKIALALLLRHLTVMKW